MNILFFSWAFPPYGGGVGSYFHNMALSLSDCGHNVIVATGSADNYPKDEILDGIRVLRIFKQSEIGTKHVVERILKIVSTHSIDIIEGADYLGDCAALLQLNERPPVIIKVHSCNILKVLNDSQILKWWQKFTIKCALVRDREATRRELISIQQADILTAPSLRILEELKRQGIRLPEKQGVIPNPILPPPESDLPESPVPTVLMVTRLDIGKGIQYLPRIMEQLSLDFPDVVLEIAGGDSYARGIGSLKNWLIRQLGDLVQNVRFLGLLNAEQLVDAYKKSWVVIIPSRWDNFPSVLLEAMSNGKPVVASPHGGMPEMLEGTLCQTALPESDDFVNLIKRFLKEPTIRRSAGESLRLKAQTAYSPETVVAKYCKLVSSMLSNV